MKHQLAGFEHHRLQGHLSLIGPVQGGLYFAHIERLVLANGLKAVVTPTVFINGEPRRTEMIGARDRKPPGWLASWREYV